LPTSNGDTGGGHWWGGVSRGGEVVHDAFCLLVEEGELACILLDTSVAPVGPSYVGNRIVGALHGAIRVSNATEATGSGKVYATPGNVLADGNSVVADFVLTGGSLDDEEGVLQLRFSSLGQESTFDGRFDHYYAVASGGLLWPAHGMYPTLHVYGDPASLSIDPAGALVLESASGCAGSGLMNNVPLPLDPTREAYNAYTVELTIADCGDLDGRYDGLATLIDFSWVNGTNNLVIAVFNESRALVGEAVK
jgi:hypothetical protein